MTSLLRTAAFAALVSVCAAAEQKTDEKPAAQADKPAATAAAGAQTPTTGPATETAVTVNGKVITEADFNEMFEVGMQGRTLPPAQVEAYKKQYRGQIINMLIDIALFDAQADEAKVTVADEELVQKAESDLNQFARSQKLSKEDLASEVKRRTGMEIKEWIAKQVSDPFFKSMLRRIKLVEKKFPDQIKVTDEEVKERYEKNFETAYKEEAKVRASHILFMTKDKSDAEKAEAKKKAAEILIEAKKPGADFAALAKQHSECGSKDQGGDLNFFPRNNAMVEPFAAAAFAMKPGEISDVVETEFGYHIIKVTERREASTTSLEEAKDAIREQVRREKIGTEMQKYTAELRKDAKIVYPAGKEPATQPAMGMGGAMRPAARPTTRPAAGK